MRKVFSLFRKIAQLHRAFMSLWPDFLRSFIDTKTRKHEEIIGGFGSVFLLTLLFVTATIISVQVRNSTRHENKNDKDSFEGKTELNHENGPEEFLKFHQGIRT